MKKATNMRAALPLFNLVISSAVFLTLFLETWTPAQSTAILIFSFVCPGISVLQFIDFRDFATNLTFMIAASLAVMSTTAGIMIYLTNWEPFIAVSSLSIVCGSLALGKLCSLKW